MSKRNIEPLHASRRATMMPRPGVARAPLRKGL